jgi:hypothetical protein
MQPVTLNDCVTLKHFQSFKCHEFPVMFFSSTSCFCYHFRSCCFAAQSETFVTSSWTLIIFPSKILHSCTQTSKRECYIYLCWWWTTFHSMCIAALYSVFLQPMSTSCKHLFLETFSTHMNGMSRFLKGEYSRGKHSLREVWGSWSMSLLSVATVWCVRTWNEEVISGTISWNCTV